jgi:hypothetical protein
MHRNGCECYLRPTATGYSKLTRLTFSPNSLPRHDHGKCVAYLPRFPSHSANRDWFFHSPCVCNHVNAIVERVGACVPYPQVAEIRRLRSRVRRLAQMVGRVTQDSLEDVVVSFSGPKRRRYELAHSDYRHRGFCADDARIKMFVKLEGVQFKDKKINPSCRAIQWRGPVYTLNLLSFVKPIERSLYNKTGGKFPSSRFFAKGLTPRSRAELLHQKWSRVSGGVIYGFDVSRCDAHFTVELLRVYTEFCRVCSGDPFFMELLRKQLRNEGSFRTNDGYGKYTVLGTTMSGDGDTSLKANVIIAAVLSLLGEQYFTEFDFLVDGDDSVFFGRGIPPSDEVIIDWFRKFGLTIEIEFKTNRFSQIEFCQSRPVAVEGWLMVRDPIKVLSKTTINPKFAIKSLRPKLLKTIATGELSIYAGVPVLDPYFRALIRSADLQMSKRGKKDGGLLPLHAWAEYRHLRDIPRDWERLRDVPITSQARATFSEAWGMDPSEQIALESWLHGWTCDIFAKEELCCPPELNPWKFDWKHPEVAM